MEVEYLSKCTRTLKDKSVKQYTFKSKHIIKNHKRGIQLTSEQCDEIINLYYGEIPYTQKNLAKQFNTTIYYIQRIIYEHKIQEKTQEKTQENNEKIISPILAN
jgi:hypothetical protein